MKRSIVPEVLGPNCGKQFLEYFETMLRQNHRTIVLALLLSGLCGSILAAPRVLAQEEQEGVQQSAARPLPEKGIDATQQPAAVVESLNGRTGRLTLAEGSHIDISRSGRTFTFGLELMPYWGFYDYSNANVFRIDVDDPDVSNTTCISGVVQGGPGNIGVVGWDDSYQSTAKGVYGYSVIGNAVTGESSGETYMGQSGYAGYFIGPAHVTGLLTKGGGAFKIDHPVDPEDKYLYHSFVESPDMMNIYNGNVVMDENGEAVVELPEWFEALNKDFRYQLTCVGGFAPVYVKDKVQGNRFAISGGQPGLEISWQVTGIRKDPFAEANRLPVEEEKSVSERGHYLHPRSYGQPKEKGIDWLRTPDTVKRLKSERAERERR